MRVCPVVIAALLLLSRQLLGELGLPSPSATELLVATKVSRASAYEMLAVLVRLLPTLVSKRGRPPKHESAPADVTHAITSAVLDFILAHPACAQRAARADARHHYSDSFRRFVVELHAEHPSVDVDAFARAIHVPLGTFKDWLRAACTPTASAPAADTAASDPAPIDDAQPDPMGARMQTVLDAWSRWEGSFAAFCEHVRRELLIPFGRSMISRVLQLHGARRAHKRDGRAPDELAMRGFFRTFFPGAQWVGDGMQLPVVVDDRRYTFNLELDVDAHTGAFVGLSVRDEEDSAAVVEAFEDGVRTTGAQPLALLLDNRPSNHTVEVDTALDGTIRIRATVGRPESKGHVEGAFGLFSQVLPALCLDTRDGPRALATRFLSIVSTLWARTTNHRPRRDRDGASRVDLYAKPVSDEQRAAARTALEETARRQLLARQTLEKRRRPEVLALLDTTFARLGLLDPERHIRVAIAGYPFDAIIAGIAIFDAKRDARTLPDGVDGHYLLGITRNVAAKTEGEHLARRLLALRLDARDAMLASLVRARDAACAAADVDVGLSTCVDRALETESELVRIFWLTSLAELIRRRCADATDALALLFERAARRIQATFSVLPRARQDAVRVLAEQLVVIS
ncbi:MAG: hypothetical protein IT374_24920 [Polyangiaceae bacterium]|nr:hypothetical protein [Polyangiaceae bacterium]